MVLQLVRAAENNNGSEIVSLTFRQQAKYFDIVKTVTHTNGSDTVVSFSDLGTIGMVIAKKTTASEDWFVSHRYKVYILMIWVIRGYSRRTILPVRRILGTN